MPQLGETVTEGTIIRWMKKVGDEIAYDEPLFEVSTDKVDSEVPSPASGYLAEILVAEGATVDVGTRLAVVTEVAPSGTVLADSAGAPAGSPPEPAASEPAPREPAASEPGRMPEGVTGSGGPARTEGGSCCPPSSGSWLPSMASTRLQFRALVKVAGSPGRTCSRSWTFARPGAWREPNRRPHRLCRWPALERAAARSYAPVAGGRDEIVPFTKIRRLTAEHMVRSKATSAHTLVVIEADYEGIERVRKAHKDQFRVEEGIGLTYLAFIARAVAETLRDYPQLNASVGDDALIIHRDVHLGIAVDLGQRGLIVPVVHHAEGQSLRGLARAMADLAERARTRKLSADEVVGGTFTITNPGPFGTFLTAPIINQPQVAILSTDGIKRRPVVVTAPDGTEAVGIHSVGLLALSFDHRAVDGAYASAFLHELARVIESRDWEAEL